MLDLSYVFTRFSAENDRSAFADDTQAWSAQAGRTTPNQETQPSSREQGQAHLLDLLVTPWSTCP